ncbi:MAG: hypothetical protein K0R29_1187 [Pseudobdellovibrio sp.]|jgi:hypothetical protein|nr:hypothetical protein [Pseudobdellovibrio sp.]
MIQNTKAQSKANIQFASAIGMTAESAMSIQKSKDILLSDVVKTPSTDSAL